MEDLNQNTTQNFTGNDSGANSQPVQTVQPMVIPVAPSAVVYGSFFERFVAVLIDGVLVGLASGVISVIFGAMGDFGKTLGSLVSMALSLGYYVYFVSQKGQTLGKKAMNLRVQNEETGQNLDVVSAILREVVGKFLSGIVLFLGYFWMLWDNKKQTWHDKLGKSVVVKVK